MKKPETVAAVTEFGRVRLSPNFFMRDFLFSDIAAVHGFANMPDEPELAIEVGTKLCKELLEPLQDVFGRIAIRSAYRSCEVNGFGNEMQKQGKQGYTCASNEANYAQHIWDKRDADGNMGATACIVLPQFFDAFPEKGDWTMLAWWIHDNLPYSTQYFFPKYWAFNLSWHENPQRRIDSYTAPRGCLTKKGLDNHEGNHRSEYKRLAERFDC